MPGIAIARGLLAGSLVGAATPSPAVPFASVDASGWFVNYAATPAAPLVEQEFSFDRPGFTSVAAPTTWTGEPNIATIRVSEPWPTSTTGNPAYSPTGKAVALTWPICAGDTLNGVTNTSTRLYPAAIGAWARVPGATWQAVSDMNLAMELVAFSPFGRLGKPVACVRYTVTDGTVTKQFTQANPIILAGTGDQNAVLGYRPAFTQADFDAFPDLALCTCNAELFPWIGTAATNSASSSELRGFSPRHGFKIAAAPMVAYVSDAAGVTDAGGQATRTDATAWANAFLTITGALTALRTANGGNLDHCRIRVRDDASASYNVAFAPISSNGLTLAAGGFTVEKDPRTSGRKSVAWPNACRPRFQSRTGATPEYRLTFRGLAVPRSATAWILDSVTLTWITFDDCTISNSSAGAWALAGANLSWTNCALTPNTANDFGQPSTAEQRMFRGCTGDFTPAATTYGLSNHLILGCVFSRTGGASQDNAQRAPNGAVVAFNRFMRQAGAAFTVQGWNAAGLLFSNIAFVQNVVEMVNGASDQPAWRISKDADFCSLKNVLVMHNVAAGVGAFGRTSMGYDDGAGANNVRTHTDVYVIGNIGCWHGNKGDRTILDGARRGNIEVLHGVGHIGNVSRNDADARMDYYGWQSIRPTFGQELATVSPPGIAFTDYQAVTGTPAGPNGNGAGDGTYSVASGSKAKGRVPRAILPCGLDGSARPTTADTAGAYA